MARENFTIREKSPQSEESLMVEEVNDAEEIKINNGNRELKPT